MNPDLLWSNLANYCLQIGLVVGIAAVIPSVLRLAEPRVRLAYWHMLLIACLVLPLFAPWRHQMVTAVTTVTSVPIAPVNAPSVPITRGISWNLVALGLLACGVVARFAGMGLGLWRLRGYRHRSTALHPPTTWGVEADLRVSPDVASPVTFGAWRPVVLLPANFPELDAAMQEAILCHEVLHVRRFDWLVTIAEECVRAVFWFHPAVWWLLGEIGLAREQAVDREVIDMTRARDEYVDALLAIAGAKHQLDLAPAPLFLRKRHLKHRVVSIMKEVRMSKARSVSALAASLTLLVAACWLVTLTFPLSAAPQTITDGPGVAVDTGSAGILHRTAIVYPASARKANLDGTVLVEATTDSAGNVVDARIVSGPAEFRRGVLQSVLQWHFANDTGANTRQIRITFTHPPEDPAAAPMLAAGSSSVAVTATAPPRGVVGGVPGGVIGGVIGGVPGGGRPMIAGRKLTEIKVLGLTEDARQRLMARVPAQVGDTMSEDLYLRVVGAVRDYDEHMTAAIRFDGDSAVILTISAPGSYTVGGGVEPASVPGRITIGGNVQSAKLVQQQRPVYPPLAKQARISGTVKLQVIINKDGTVQDIKVISGHPLFIPPTIEAVKNWVYQPTLLNGQPVEVLTQVDVNFTLSDEPPQIPQQQ